MLYSRELNLRRVLVVCSGNTCRSPMAESIIRARIDAAGLATRIDVRSAGVSALPGHGASVEAVQVMAAQGIDLSGHRSQRLTRKMIEWADLILAMEEAHRYAILKQVPAALPKTLLFTQLADRHDDIDDPYGGSQDAYAAISSQLTQMIGLGWARLLQAINDDI